MCRGEGDRGFASVPTLSTSPTFLYYLIPVRPPRRGRARARGRPRAVYVFRALMRYNEISFLDYRQPRPENNPTRTRELIAQTALNSAPGWPRAGGPSGGAQASAHGVALAVCGPVVARGGDAAASERILPSLARGVRRKATVVGRTGPPRGAHAERDQLAHREVARDGARESDDGRREELPRVASDELRACLQPLRSRLIRVRVGGEDEGWEG